MQVQQGITGAALTFDFLNPQYDFFWDLETILLVVMIDFHKITHTNVVLKDDLISYSQKANDRKGSSAARIAAEHFEDLQELLLALEQSEAEACQPSDICDVSCENPPGFSLNDLLKALKYASENSCQVVTEYFPGLRFPCC